MNYIVVNVLNMLVVVWVKFMICIRWDIKVRYMLRMV